MTSSTIKHYDEYGEAYYDTTVSVDMRVLYEPFLKELNPGSKILDAGCGSGRDSYFFKQQGFQVTAFDASAKMVELSSQLFGEKVLLMRFEDLELPDRYDGIWACASLLHVERTNLTYIIHNLSRYLRDGGVFYMSFKYGDGEFWKDGRYFNCLDENALEIIIDQIPHLKIEKLSQSTDVRPGREDERWLNAYLRKLA